jgi:hypothetical protein
MCTLRRKPPGEPLAVRRTVAPQRIELRDFGPADAARFLTVQLKGVRCARSLSHSFTAITMRAPLLMLSPAPWPKALPAALR